MPVDFLSETQRAAYSRYAAEPSAEQLARYFHLDAHDRSVIATRRGDENRLGFAVQLGTVRFLGIFLPRPTEVPDGVVRFVATQLGIRDTTSFARYAQRTASHREHASEIQKRYGYRPSSDPAESFQLLRWLYTRATLSAERPSVLFDRATSRLVERKVLLPGVTVLERLVSSVRNRAVGPGGAAPGGALHHGGGPREPAPALEQVRGHRQITAYSSVSFSLPGIFSCSS